jgi:hypothetical protein
MTMEDGSAPSGWFHSASVAWRRFLGHSECLIFGHQNSGEFFASTRVWQRCARCGGWLGWVFRWERPWTREDAIAALEGHPEAIEAVLRLSWRRDGGLRISSPSHPGMVLSHSRADWVMLDVLPVLAELGFTPPASVDTHPQGGDPAQTGAQASLSGAVAAKRTDAQPLSEGNQS